MEQVIILRYGELHLKGKNRNYFEKKLIDDIKIKLKGIPHSFSPQHGRYLIYDFNQNDIYLIIDKCKKVFGLHSLSLAYKCPTDINEIEKCCFELAKDKTGTFKVIASRADKSFEYNSMQLQIHIGAKILENNNNLRVDLHNPMHQIYIDVREEGYTLIFFQIISCIGGMPLNSAGKGLLLLSGGLDSPVAGYLMQRRGLSVFGLHFHSYPYTNERALKKVEELAQKLANYSNVFELGTIKLTNIQEKIKRYCDEKYTVIILRMIMMKIAEIVAKQQNLQCIINGESLGQVASQTMDSIFITDSMVNMPVFRPLIGMDKHEIIEISKRIDTYDISILPFEDCCTIFLPKHPITRPNLEKAIEEYNKITGLDDMILEAVKNMEVKTIYSE